MINIDKPHYFQTIMHNKLNMHKNIIFSTSNAQVKSSN